MIRISNILGDIRHRTPHFGMRDYLFFFLYLFQLYLVVQNNYGILNNKDINNIVKLFEKSMKTLRSFLRDYYRIDLDNKKA